MELSTGSIQKAKEEWEKKDELVEELLIHLSKRCGKYSFWLEDAITLRRRLAILKRTLAPVNPPLVLGT